MNITTFIKILVGAATALTVATACAHSPEEMIAHATFISPQGPVGIVSDSRISKLITIENKDACSVNEASKRFDGVGQSYFVICSGDESFKRLDENSSEALYSALSRDSWAKHYFLPDPSHPGLKIAVISDIDSDSNTEIWATYKTMYDEFGFVIFEINGRTLSRMIGSCLNCGD